MLSKLIVKSYSTLIEIALWVFVLAGFVGGWKAEGPVYGVISGLFAFVFCVVFFGAFLILGDIHRSVSCIEAASKKSGQLG